MDQFTSLILNSKNWLVENVLGYAKKLNYFKYTSTRKKDWHTSIASLSSLFVKVLNENSLALNFGPDDNFSKDTIASLGMLLAQKHRKHGVSMGMFLGLFKYYRQSYIELAMQAGFEHYYERDCFIKINWFFDRVELGVCTAWADLQEELLATKKDLEQRFTELEKNREELAQVNSQFNNIIDFLPDATFVIDKDKKVIAWNKAIEEMTGVKKEDIVGKGNKLYAIPFHGKPQSILVDLLNADDRIVLKNYNLLERQGDTLHAEGFAPALYSGRGAYLKGKAALLFDGRGNYNGAIESIRDITDRKKAEEALHREKEQLAVTLASIGDGVITVDLEGVVTLLNPVAETLIGYRQAEAIGRPLNDIFNIINEYTGEPAKNPVNRVLAEGKVVGLANHTALVAKDGTKRSISDSAAPIMDKTGKLLGAILVFRDVTEERQKEEALKKSEERFRFLAENARDIIFRIQIQPEAKFEYISPAIASITGYETAEFYQNPKITYRLLHPDEWFVLDNLFAGKYSLGTKPLITKWIHRNGDVIWTEQQNTPIYNDNEELIAVEGIVRDITKRKKAEEKLKYISFHDSLTRVYNRAYFEQEMRRLENGRFNPLGIIVCDVDGLKLVNDTLGHDTGDELLVIAANLIKKAFRKSDVVARIGGDEFAVLMPNSDDEVVETACNRIKSALLDYNGTNAKLPLSLSVGWAVSNDTPVKMDELFKEADNNMYREKLHRNQSARSAIVQTLMKALEARDFMAEGHADRMKDLVEAIAKAIGLSKRRISDLRLLAQFHDIGKVGIPDRILLKDGPLTTEEVIEMQRHCEIGYRIAQSAPDLVPIADWILKHHERWDGKGYPLGLKKRDIPLECRILAIADAFDAMITYRPYRKALSHTDALKEIRRCAGSQFDPLLVEKFIDIIQQ